MCRNVSNFGTWQATRLAGGDVNFGAPHLDHFAAAFEKVEFLGSQFLKPLDQRAVGIPAGEQSVEPRERIVCGCVGLGEAFGLAFGCQHLPGSLGEDRGRTSADPRQKLPPLLRVP